MLIKSHLLPPRNDSGREREGHGEKTTSSQSAALKSLILSLSGMMEGRGAPSVEH